jgi:hypothetical protein
MIFIAIERGKGSLNCLRHLPPRLKVIGKEHDMPRFMGIHTFPKNAFSYDQVCQFGAAAQQDAKVKGYRSFVSPAEGKAVCIMDAPDKQAVADWFRKMNMPTDMVVEVAIEGDGGNMKQLAASPAMASV